jgi:hypothetical protein
MNVSDYIVSVLAREVVLDALAPQTAVRPQYEELPISAAEQTRPPHGGGRKLWLENPRSLATNGFQSIC